MVESAQGLIAPITQQGDYDSNLTGAEEKSLHHGGVRSRRSLITGIDFYKRRAGGAAPIPSPRLPRSFFSLWGIYVKSSDTI